MLARFFMISSRIIVMDAAMRLKDEPPEFGMLFPGRIEAMEGLPLACFDQMQLWDEKRKESGTY